MISLRTLECFLSLAQLSQAAPPWGAGNGAPKLALRLWAGQTSSVSMWPCYLVDVTV